MTEQRMTLAWPFACGMWYAIYHEDSSEVNDIDLVVVCSIILTFVWVAVIIGATLFIQKL